jgi:hypothetical protein
MKRINKQPGETKAIKVDFSLWLASLASPAVIETAATAIDPGMQIVDVDILANGIVDVHVTGGVVGQAYNLAVDAITDTGLTERRDYRIGVRGPGLETIVDLGGPGGEDDDLIDGGGP